MRSRLGVHQAVVVAGVWAAIVVCTAVAPAARAHALPAACQGAFVNTDGHGAGDCELAFQGLPVGVRGGYTAGAADARAQIHVELFVVLVNGEERALVECGDPLSATARKYGTAECEQERNDAGMAVTLPEPLPADIVSLRCEAHSHAPAPVPGDGTFACWSSDEARDSIHLASAGAPTVATAVPINTFLPEVMVASRSGSLTFVNTDLNPHDFVAEVRGDDGVLRPDHVRPDGPWCVHYDGDCPLFWTDLLQSGTSAVVQGLGDAVSGATYHFYCSIHPYMKGELVVID